MILVDKDTAYLLHTKPYRENSLLAYLFTQQHGKVSFIVNGIKSAKAGKASGQASKSALLQPCRPMRLSYQLKDGLSKINDLELAQSLSPPNISHFMLYQYAHELLLTLLPQHHPAEPIFSAYELFLDALRNEQPHFALRLLELALLDYFDGLNSLYSTPTLRSTINVGVEYYLDNDNGIAVSNPSMEKSPAGTLRVSGQSLSAFNHLVRAYQQQLPSSNQSPTSPHVIEPAVAETLARGAQPINTFFIARLLGNKKLKTRNIYRELQGMKLL